MKYRILATVTVVGSMALGGAVAEAHNRTFPTSVEFQGVYQVNGLTAVGGQVTSRRARCVPNRTVKVFAIRSGSRELVDIARTSDNGAFVGLGDFTNAIDARAQVTRKNIGGRNHRHICAGASTTFSDSNNNNTNNSP